jgi:hypothetical protein
MWFMFFQRDSTRLSGFLGGMGSTGYIPDHNWCSSTVDLPKYSVPHRLSTAQVVPNQHGSALSRPELVFPHYSVST